MEFEFFIKYMQFIALPRSLCEITFTLNRSMKNAIQIEWNDSKFSDSDFQEVYMAI